MAEIRAAKARVVANPTEDLSPIEADLLLGRTLAQWPGHKGDALVVYDQVIKAQRHCNVLQSCLCV